MDTKWKKGKVLCSFAAFAAGMSLLLTNLPLAVCASLTFAGQELSKSGDYQETAQFRHLIEERLSSLLEISTGAPGWTGIYSDNYLVWYGQYGYGGGRNGLLGWLDRNPDMGTAAIEIAEASSAVEVETEAASDAVTGTVTEESAAEYGYYGYWEESPSLNIHYSDREAYLQEQTDYYGDDFVDGYWGSGGSIYFDEEGNVDREKSLEAYLYNMAQNKNLLYAVVSYGELRYTNIEGLEEKAFTPWDGADFEKLLPAGEYNFLLWYNREGDGKVQITKNGWAADVYGDGIYRESNLWRVPGYANFKLGDQAKEAVIFLAAAKTPQVYLVGGYGGGQITRYGGSMYDLNEWVKLWGLRAWRAYHGLAAGIVLLLLAFILRKSLRTAFEGLAKLLGKLPLLLKLAVFLILAAFAVPFGGDAFGQVGWYMTDRLFWGYDGAYLLKQATIAGNCLAVWFWLLFAAVLDGRANVRRQRQEMQKRWRMRELKYPVQKRLVKRARNRLFAEGGVILLAVAVLMAGYLAWTTYIRTYYDYWEWYDDGRIFGFRGLAGLVVMASFAVVGTLTAFVLGDLWRLRKSRRLAEDIGALSDRIGAVKRGELTEELKLPEDTDLREAAENLNEISTGLEKALSEQIKSERMKVELVTNVSHDIKTPLTSIISYVELLRQEKDLPREVQEYIVILGEKSERLRSIVQDVFEVSKAASGQLPVKSELLDLGKLLRQTLADMNGRIEESALTVRTAIPQNPVQIQADGERLYRVFQNLLDNALRYSLEGSRIYLTLVSESGDAVVRIKNTSGMELAGDKDFTERFVRGDDSRTDGGSGLGLSIARSFTEACGGSFLVETDADLFTVTVSFPESSQEMTMHEEVVGEDVEESKDISE